MSATTEGVEETCRIRVALSATTRADAVTIMTDVYGSVDCGFGHTSDRFSFRYGAIGDDRVTLRTVRVTERWQGRLDPDGQFILLWSVVEGAQLTTADGEQVTLAAGIPVMLPSGHPVHLASPPGTLHLVHFHPSVLEEAATAGSGRPQRGIRFPLTASPEDLAPLRDVIAAAAPVLLNPRTRNGVRASVDLLIAESVVEAFRPVDQQQSDGSTPFDRATLYMRERFDEPLTVSDIAKAAGISVRTLQQLFTRRERMSPLRFLRSVRLSEVRVALQHGDPRFVTVAEIALSCGFRHMGRFSADYHSVFGEYPSATLRRDAPIIREPSVWAENRSY